VSKEKINLAKRSVFLRDSRNWNQTELAKKLGVSRNYVSMLERGQSVDMNSSLYLLFTVLETASEDKAVPKEVPLTETNDKFQDIDPIAVRVHNLITHSTDAALVFSKLVEVYEESLGWSMLTHTPIESIPPQSLPAIQPSPVKKKTHSVPIISGVAAGSPAMTEVLDEIELPAGYSSDCSVFTVTGDSMTAEVGVSIPDGSLIICTPVLEGLPRQGSIVVYDDGYGSSLKVLGYRKAVTEQEEENANVFGKLTTLSSLNPDYPEIEIMEGGRVNWKFVGMMPEEN